MSNYKIAVEVAKEVGLGNNVTSFFSEARTPQEVDQMIRGAFLEELGTDKMDNIYTYQENKYKIFRILTETVSPTINARLEDTMGRLAEVRNVSWGDATVFDIENADLFEVAVIADGTANLRRQRLDNGKVDVTMNTLGVSIYEEFYRFLAGRVNWGQMVDKVARSFEHRIATLAYDAIYGSYDNLDARYKYTGTFDESAVLEVLQAVEAHGGNAVIVGTKAALAKIKPEYVGGATKDGYNALGYVGVFNGYETIELAQSYKPGTDEFALSTTDLLILPNGADKLVKIVHEGDAIIQDKQNDSDLTIEHTFIKKVGVGLAVAKNYGIVKLT